MEFTNTHKDLKSIGLTWNVNCPFREGNTIYPTYDAGENSTAPLTGILDGGYPFMAANNPHGTGICIVVNTSPDSECPTWIRTGGIDLSDAIENAEWAAGHNHHQEVVPSDLVYIEKSNEHNGTLILARVARVPRIFTWHDFNVFVVKSTSDEESITIEVRGSSFLRTTDGRFFARQNNHWWVEAIAETHGTETLVSAPAFMSTRRNIRALFVKTEFGWYEYEAEGELFPFDAARQAIAQKIAADNASRISDQEVYKALQGMELTIEDSRAVGNCDIGTDRFIRGHGLKLVDGIFRINSENKEMVWNIALENRQFMRVLKNKIAQ